DEPQQESDKESEYDQGSNKELGQGLEYDFEEEFGPINVDDEPNGLDQTFNGVTNQELEEEPQQESDSESEYDQDSNEELDQGLEDDFEEEIEEEGLHEHSNDNKILGY